GMPRIRAASASACAWLPELCVTTPRAAASSDSAKTALHAPRNLNAPTFCKFSHLKNSDRPASRSSVAHVITGVRCAWPAIRLPALRTSASETAYDDMLPPILLRYVSRIRRSQRTSLAGRPNVDESDTAVRAATAEGQPTTVGRKSDGDGRFPPAVKFLACR